MAMGNTTHLELLLQITVVCVNHSLPVKQAYETHDTES